MHNKDCTQLLKLCTINSKLIKEKGKKCGERFTFFNCENFVFNAKNLQLLDKVIFSWRALSIDLEQRKDKCLDFKIDNVNQWKSNDFINTVTISSENAEYCMTNDLIRMGAKLIKISLECIHEKKNKNGFYISKMPAVTWDITLDKKREMN